MKFQLKIIFHQKNKLFNAFSFALDFGEVRLRIDFWLEKHFASNTRFTDRPLFFPAYGHSSKPYSNIARKIYLNYVFEHCFFRFGAHESYSVPRYGVGSNVVAPHSIMDLLFMNVDLLGEFVSERLDSKTSKL